MKDLTDNEVIRLTHLMSELTIRIERFEDVKDKLPKPLINKINSYAKKIHNERKRRSKPTLITINDTR